jgi:hypothetical protein
MNHARCRHRFHAQRGVAAVEFALLAIILLVFIFGTIELARVVYLWSTMTQVTSQTARGAAITNRKDPVAWNAMRRRAMFLTAPGQTALPFGGNIGLGHLQIEYLRFDAETVAAAAPLCPAQNTVNCLNDPHGASCVRFVRVRLCNPDNPGCTKVVYQPLAPLPGINKLSVNMPWFTAIVPIGTMGTPGDCT